MSSEILGKEYIFSDLDANDDILNDPTPLLQEKEVPVHNAVHDLEGFFWVLAWLCLSRDGPARRRRELLPDNTDPQQASFRTAFAKTFEAGDDVLALAKQRLFAIPRYFVESILQNISNYCKPLDKLLRKFYSTLRDAHRSHSIKGLYDKVISAFDDAEATVAQMPRDFIDAYRALEKAEEERRCKDGDGHWDVHSPPTKCAARSGGQPNASGSLQQQCEPLSPTPAKRPKIIQAGSGSAGRI
jgi:hypothetical protein